MARNGAIAAREEGIARVYLTMAEGATLVAGGPGLPEGLNRGHYVRPTVFGNVHNKHRQVGNAVPVGLAEAVGAAMFTAPCGCRPGASWPRR